MRRSRTFLLLVLGAVSLGQAASAPGARIVFCAPGYPGSTAEAQTTMDRFAAALSARIGQPAGTISAVYHETEEGGLAALREGTDIAVVPLPFFVKHARELGLTPVLQAVPEGTGATERWSLVAKAGRLSSPSDLGGWEIVSVAGYSPGFVRGAALSRWGAVPADIRIRSTSLVLSSLRKAAQGADVAVLLDGAQAAALPDLPFAKDLAVVATSEPLPASVVARVGSRGAPERIERVVAALRALEGDAAGKAILAEMRMDGFTGADLPALETARRTAGN